MRRNRSRGGVPSGEMKINANITPKSLLEALRRRDGQLPLTRASVVRRWRNDETDNGQIFVQPRNPSSLVEQTTLPPIFAQ